MFNKFFKKIVFSKNEREIGHFLPILNKVNELELRMKNLSDSQLKALTPIFKERLAQGLFLDDLLPEAFAAVREAAKRTMGQRHFDVQVIGGIVLHQGKIAEMKTGEGKTLAATLPVYLNALVGHGVHVVTVNDYLASRDADWMGGIYSFMGLTVGCVLNSLGDNDRRTAYAADITYGTNNEFGFDYLRDNMKFNLIDMVQRKFYYAILDEVDSILIDEARTPLIISGIAEKSTSICVDLNRIITRLNSNCDFTIDEKFRFASFTDEGIARCEKLLRIDNLYDPKNIEILHHLQQALKAHTLFKRDVDYIIKDNEVVLVDEFTGRLMFGRRYADGLHQALEAKEGVKIANENQTLAAITFQNYFRLYQKLAGMTGTAITEAEELYKIYQLKVIVIPTHCPMIRIDKPDLVYRTQEEKIEAIVQKIKELYAKRQPILVGTISIEKSEHLSKKLSQAKIPHAVLNAKQHAREAEFIAQAGRLGAVTISTNMAGRGTDIILGGNPVFLARQATVSREKNNYFTLLEKYEKECADERIQVCTLGGLYVLGTERHESRRIDNQLRGRSGRQGDPGFSCFYLSLEDDLLRLFGSDRISGLMQKLGMKYGKPIEARIISKAIENAQRKIENHNFEFRKNLLEYDDVLNKQREIIYAQRRLVLTGENIHNVILEMISDVVKNIIFTYAHQTHLTEYDYSNFEKVLILTLGFKPNLDSFSSWIPDELSLIIAEQAKIIYQKKNSQYSVNILSHIERIIFLQVLDNLWQDHLLNMDYLKEGITLRSYGQKDPLREYQREGYKIFLDMVNCIKAEVVEKLMKLQVKSLDKNNLFLEKQKEIPCSIITNNKLIMPNLKKNKKNKVERNALCPCGSNKKYKKCCGYN